MSLGEREDLNWGEDKRWFPRFTAFIQRLTQIERMHHAEPTSIAFALLPPLIVVNIGFPFYWPKPRPIPHAQIAVRPVIHLRAGFRRDMNTGEYYFTLALKREERTKLW